MQDGDLLLIENHTDARIQFTWDSRRYVVNEQRANLPGRGFVPFAAVVLRYGDPRSGPQPARMRYDDGSPGPLIPSRAEEIHRLSTRYGVYDPNDIKAIRAKMPKIVAHTMDADDDEDAIVFPIDDPDCDKFMPQQSDISQFAMAQRQLDKLRRTQAALEAQLAALTGKVQSNDDEEELEEDLPPTSRRQSSARRALPSAVH